MKKLVYALALVASLGFPTVAFALDRDESASIAVYEQASKAVVTIRSRGGSGTGAIIDPGGLIITNNHVVRGARNVEVRTADGRTYTGAVRSMDPQSDLALVEIRPMGTLTSLRLANSAARVGQRVYAIGNPFGLERTLTVGILSRINPDSGDLQTDAALNPGNSGGPLLNSDGELIGVNKAILSAGGGNIGIGFATPAPRVRQLVAAGSGSRTRTAITPRTTPRRLGVVLDPQTLMVLEVQANSPAERSGLVPGDRLLGINNAALRSPVQLQQALEGQPANLVLTVEREQRVGRVKVEL
ncbi:MAG: trypsin-like peptidase domain-containing protein [Gemmatimonadaceae bacterium]|nr:trypsin-like peptidase domain-containing protein [Gloeobacterales cyanobacterium ES-bin-141]